MQKRLIGFLLFILLLNLISAYGFSIGQYFDQIGGENVILILIFFASFALINWLLSKSIKENKSVSAILSLCSATLISYGAYRSDAVNSINNFFSGFYFSNPFSNFYFSDIFNFDFSSGMENILSWILPLVVLLGIIFLIFRKWKIAFIFFIILFPLAILPSFFSNWNLYIFLTIGFTTLLIVVGVFIYFFKKMTKGYHLSKVYKKLHKI